jgi:hypothetical protein
MVLGTVQLSVKEPYDFQWYNAVEQSNSRVGVTCASLVGEFVAFHETRGAHFPVHTISTLISFLSHTKPGHLLTPCLL